MLQLRTIQQAPLESRIAKSRFRKIACFNRTVSERCITQAAQRKICVRKLALIEAHIDETIGRKLLGRLNLGKNIIIADPSCKPDSESALRIDNLAPGKYDVFIDRQDCQEFGVRTTGITIANIAYPYQKPKQLLKEITVDTATVGIYDKNYRIGAQQKDPKWLKFIDKCATHNKLPNDKAVACLTGFGDGDYPVFVRYDKIGQIYAISIRFIED